MPLGVEPQEHYYIGSVENVLHAEVPQELKEKRFLASDFKYGFELGSPQSIYNLGESILLNGMLYTSRTDQTRDERNPLMWGPEFVTPGIFLLPHEAVPTHSFRFFDFDHGISFTELYSELYAQIKRPFSLCGCMELDILHSSEIIHAPIDGRDIFKNKEYYFKGGKHKEHFVNIAIMGVVSDPNDMAQALLNEQLKRVLYYNPFEGKHTLASHTHGLVIDKPLKSVEDVKPSNAISVVHILEDSKIRWANLGIYAIRRLKEFAG